jgi:hypothetical protein
LYGLLPYSPAPGAEATEADSFILLSAVMGATRPDGEEPEGFSREDIIFYCLMAALFIFVIAVSK